MEGTPKKSINCFFFLFPSGQKRLRRRVEKIIKRSVRIPRRVVHMFYGQPKILKFNAIFFGPRAEKE
jgi:hypothetical protein